LEPAQAISLQDCILKDPIIKKDWWNSSSLSIRKNNSINNNNKKPKKQEATKEGRERVREEGCLSIVCSL
jgi:hypothetical protein